MRFACGILLTLLVPSAPLLAEITPQPGPGDPHIQSVAYDGAQVVGLHIADGYAVTVQFSPDERIETVTLGDSGNWLVQTNKRADNLVVKPLGSGAPTNLTVITDARVYNFTLYAAYPGEGVQPYLVSFLYPSLSPGLPPASPPEGRYSFAGARKLLPAEMSDDGVFTRIRWAEGVAMPAVYRGEGWGRRALVNGVGRDGAYVIEGVYDHLVFVLGSDVAHAKRRKPARIMDEKP